MKRAVSISLDSSCRDKEVTINFAGQAIELERIGTDGDAYRAKALFTELDGQVDCLSMGGVDLYLRLEDREYPLHAALKLVENVKQTPVADGRGLKHTLERRVFDLVAAIVDYHPQRYKQALVPVAVDRLGSAQAAPVSQVLGHGESFYLKNCFGELGAIVVLCWVSACLGGLGASTVLLRRVATNVAEHFAERDV